MKSLFIAVKIEPTQSFIDVFNELTSKVKYENFRFVEMDKLHLTLRYLGQTDEQKVPDIDHMLMKIAETSKSFTLNIKNTGVFGSSYKPRVLWFGIEHNEHLIHLHTAIIVNLVKVGFLPDTQNFVPHITLTRIKKFKDEKLFQRLINEFRVKDIMSQYVETFSLIESIKQGDGVIHNILKTYSLQQ